MFSNSADTFVSNMMYESILEHNRNLPILTLYELSLIKIITSLCNHQKLRELIFRCNFQNQRSAFKLYLRNGAEWKAVEAMANGMVSQLCKSFLLQKRILEYLWPTSYRMMVWKSTYAICVFNSSLLHFHWTERGKIDNTRTVRCLIENRNVSVRERFFLACNVCLRNEIFEIWKEMLEIDEAYFHYEDVCMVSPLTDYWTHLVTEMDYDSESDYNSEDFIGEALSYASKFGLLEAVKYFFTIAPEYEKEFFATECMGELISKIESGHLLEENEIDIACIIFSQIADEEFFDDWFETVLSLLLHSRKYELCRNLLKERLKSGYLNDIARALAIIFYTYHLKVDNDDKCRLLFIDFWQKIPTWMRKAPKLRTLRMEFLSVLIRDNFPFILEKGAFQKISELTSLDFKFNNSDKQVDFHQGKWDFLHFIIQEVIATPLLQMPKTKILSLLNKRQSNYAVCYRMFRFVSKVQRENPIQRE